jgi:Kef-type K+ transport system membrane component KefB
MNTLIDSPEVGYGLLVVGLFIVPRILQRFRLPAAVVAVALGAVAGMEFNLFHGDSTIQLFSTLGIVALFLFAGLEVDFTELAAHGSVLTQHLVLQVAMLTIGGVICVAAFDLSGRAAALYSLALLTPSTGFILDSLASFGLTKTSQFWVKSKAIATEVVALVLLLVIVQLSSAQALGLSLLALFAMVAILPAIFRGFAKVIAPHAPGTEFTFLILVALVCAFITRKLGVYYLVGAFAVGLSAVRVRKELPALSSEKLLGGVELFASFFIPFYFFKAGLGFERSFFTKESIGLGLAMAAILVPAKTLVVALHRNLSMGEAWRKGARVGLALVPTLVFTLVIGGILRERFAIADNLYGALVVYTLINTVIPGVVLRSAPQFESPTVPAVPSLFDIDAEPAPPVSIDAESAAKV